MAKFPAPEVATTTMALLLLLSLAAPVFAQAGAQNVPIPPKDPLEKRLHSEIVLHVRLPPRARQLRHAQLRRTFRAVGEDSATDGRRERP